MRARRTSIVYPEVASSSFPALSVTIGTEQMAPLQTCSTAMHCAYAADSQKVRCASLSSDSKGRNVRYFADGEGVALRERGWPRSSRATTYAPASFEHAVFNICAALAGRSGRTGTVRASTLTGAHILRRAWRTVRGPRAHVRRIRTSRPGTSMMGGAKRTWRVDISRPCDSGSPGPHNLPSTMTNNATLNHAPPGPILDSFPTSELLSEKLADFVIKVRG